MPLSCLARVGDVKAWSFDMSNVEHIPTNLPIQDAKIPRESIETRRMWRLAALRDSLKRPDKDAPFEKVRKELDL